MRAGRLRPGRSLLKVAANENHELPAVGSMIADKCGGPAGATGKPPAKENLIMKFRQALLIPNPMRIGSAMLLYMIFLLTTAASAQVGGTADISPARSAGPVSIRPVKPPSTVTQQFEKEGIQIDFTFSALPDADGKEQGLVAGADATVSFKLTDKRTGQPITGLHPNAWMSARKGENPPNEAECRDKIKTFMGGLLSVRPDVDLNSYVMLTINHDNTITFINPQVAFNITKLESIIPLPGPGADWVLSKDKNFLYVTLPEQSSVAVINTITRKIVGTVSTGEKTRPMRVAVQPDGRYVWVGLDGSALAVAIDTASNKVAATVPAGEGLHNFAFTADSRFAYVTNSAADTVSAIDTRSLTKVADIKVGKTPVPVALSAASGLIYVAAINGDNLSVIDPDKQQVIREVPVGRGVVAFRFDPEGRFGFAVNQVASTVSVIDASTNSVIGSTAVVKSPDQVTFTRRYAYIRGTGSEKFSLIEVSEVAKKGKVAPVEVQAGRQPASMFPAEIGVADMIQPTPEGNAVMIANTPDMMLYYYVEGMMAPMGTFQNYKRRPHALMVIDRSLSEVSPGVYSSPLKLKYAGHFDVPMVIDQPRIINCFEARVADSPDGEKRKPVVSVALEPLFKGGKFKPGDPVSLRFRVNDSLSKQPVSGLKDVQVLTFEPPGIWQQRQWAKEAGDGVYEITQTFPREALYHVMVQIPSRGVRYADFPYTPVPVMAQETKESQK